MDLPERLQGKISSRIGNHRLVYEPYNQEQIKTILGSRLESVQEIFDTNSLRFVAKKVSTYSGDIRRSLQITKRAVEIAREQHQEESKPKKGEVLNKVTYTNVLQAFDELFNSKTVQVLKTFSKLETIVVMALYHVL